MIATMVYLNHGTDYIQIVRYQPLRAEVFPSKQGDNRQQGCQRVCHNMQVGDSLTAAHGAIDAGTAVKTCNVCHAPGRMPDVIVVHGLQ